MALMVFVGLDLITLDESFHEASWSDFAGHWGYPAFKVVAYVEDGENLIPNHPVRRTKATFPPDRSKM